MVVIIMDSSTAPTPRLKALSKYKTRNVHRDGERYPHLTKANT